MAGMYDLSNGARILENSKISRRSIRLSFASGGTGPSHIGGKILSRTWALLASSRYRVRARKRQLEGKSCLGVAKILSQGPLGAPKSSARSPRPRFHAVSERARKAMREAFKAFIDAFLLASAEFLEGKEGVVFPDGSLPPARPFFAGIRAGSVIADFAVP